MITNVTVSIFPGGRDGLAVATSSIEKAMFYWWISGERVKVSTCNVFQFHLDEDEELILDVFDDAQSIPEPTFPARDRLQWEHAEGAERYIIEEYVALEWIQRAVVRDIGQWMFSWQTRVLEDCQFHTFRIRSENAHSSSLYKTFFMYMLRTPTRPIATRTINVQTGVLSFE